MRKLFVGNLSWKAAEEELRPLFEKHGPVQSLKIITDPYTGRSKGFAFVEMESPEAAQNALKELDGALVIDRNIRVSIAHDRERSERGGDRGGDRGGMRGGGGGDRGERKPRPFNRSDRG